AQGLRCSVTSVSKLHQNPNHRAYILREDDADLDSVAGKDSVFAEEGNVRNLKVLGLLKVGVKNLFVADNCGRQMQVTPLCVLDFYVHESVQRSGYGKHLFDYMLEIEGIAPIQLAYDRPSPRLLCFLRKYFDLTDCMSKRDAGRRSGNNGLERQSNHASEEETALRENGHESKTLRLPQISATPKTSFEGTEFQRSLQYVTTQTHQSPMSAGNRSVREEGPANSNPHSSNNYDIHSRYALSPRQRNRPYFEDSSRQTTAHDMYAKQQQRLESKMQAAEAAEVVTVKDNYDARQAWRDLYFYGGDAQNNSFRTRENNWDESTRRSLSNGLHTSSVPSLPFISFARGQADGLGQHKLSSPLTLVEPAELQMTF
ncbi:Alpha-tubulin N-acetyltransferase 1, partial [Blyttiomyces sp. JEL0837]